MIGLIDGDMLLYKATISSEQDAQFGEDLHILYAHYGRAKDIFDSTLQELLERAKCDEYEIYYSGAGNWRKEVLPSYKANRKGGRKPLCFARLKEEVLQDPKARIEDGLEADDLIGIRATRNDDDTVIIAEDKDFACVPGKFIHLSRQDETGPFTVRNISKEEADYNHILQGFMGDKVDGYPGCPGVGIKTAMKIMDKVVQVPGKIQEDELVSVWETVVIHFQRQGLTEKTALKNARVARILRYVDVEGDDVILWNPHPVPF